MRTLSTIQKREKLNTVKVMDEPGPGGANHLYMIETPDEDIAIQFQCGPRNESGSTHGVIDTDLLFELEMKGMVKALAGGMYHLIS